MKCWVHKDMHELRDEVLQKVQDAWDDVTEKVTCTIDLTGQEKDFWMGSEAGMLGCYWFRGVVFAGDRSNHRGRRGAGAFCLGDPEGTSSNRPELAALVLALRATKTTDDMLYLCDNQALLKAEEEKGTRRSVWTAGVRKTVRKGAGQFVVKSTREKATKRWRELHFERGCQERLGGAPG